MRARLAREAGLPAPRLVGLAGWPVTWYNARKVGANDTEHVRKTVETLPALLDHVDDLLNEGTIGGEQRNAADFQIGTSVRLLMTFEDLAPALGPCGGALRHRADARLPDRNSGRLRPAGMARAPSSLTRRAAGSCSLARKAETTDGVALLPTRICESVQVGGVATIPTWHAGLRL